MAEIIMNEDRYEVNFVEKSIETTMSEDSINVNLIEFFTVSGGSEPTSGSHNDLTDRGLAGQHPISAITNLQTELDEKSNIVHQHIESDITDLDKYTKSETDTLLSEKSNIVHEHIASDITDFDTEITNNTAVIANTAKITYPPTDSTKLSGIEPNATADQTGAEIKSAYEGESNTNGFTDGEKTKLSGIEDSATSDQSGSEIKSLYESELNTNAYTDAEKTKLAGLESSLFLGTYVNLSSLQLAHPSPIIGSYGHVDLGVGSDVEVYIWDDTDSIYVLQLGSSTAETSATIKVKYESNPDTNAYTDTEKNKLAGIEIGATADQSNVEIKALYEDNPDTNAFTDTQQTKLSGIATGAEVNINSDWNSVSGDSEILNKPSEFAPEAHNHVEADITNLDKYTKSEIDVALALKLNDITAGNDIFIDKTDPLNPIISFKMLGFETTLITIPNIVSVFHYDTSQDSDGGAWRKRCQHTAWYNAPLNTATRGKTREFPASIRGVVELDKVTIFDVTDPDCPMWMVFPNVLEGILTQGTDVNVVHSSVSMSNGVMTVGNKHLLGSGFVTALIDVNFVADTTWCYPANTVHYTNFPQYCGKWVTGIANRSTGGGYRGGLSTDPVIINANINDVAMTVRPDAPVDQTTGLPAPTIAVATDGGISIIDGPAGVGTVVDSASSAVYGRIVFNGLEMFFGTSGNATAPLRHVRDISSLLADGWAYSQYATNVSPALLATSSKIPSKGELLSIGSSDGLTIIKENPQTPADGMIAYITKSYNSGWMLGDIKGAWLADTVEETIGTDITTEHVINGIFDDAVGWTPSTGMSIANGVAKFDNAALNNDSLSQNTASFKAGKTYRMVWSISERNTGSLRVVIRTPVAEYIGEARSLAGVYTEFFTLSADSTSFEFQVRAVPMDLSIGVVSIQEVTEHLTSWTNRPSTGYETFSSTGTEIVTAISTDSYSEATSGPFSLTIGKVYRAVIDVTVNSGAAPMAATGTDSSVTNSNFYHTQLSAGINVITFKHKRADQEYLWLINNAPGDWSATTSLTEAHNLVENGEFSSIMSWDVGTHWEITGGKAVATVANGAEDRLSTTDAILYRDRVIRVTLDAVVTSGSITCYRGSTTETLVDGHNDFILAAEVTTSLSQLIFTTASFTGTLDNIRVQEVTLVDGQWVADGELAVNGQFEGLTTGWIPRNGAIVTAVGGAMKIAGDGPGGTNNPYAYTEITGLTIGDTYLLSVETPISNYAVRTRVGETAGGDEVFNIVESSNPGATYSYSFKATQTNHFIRVGVSSDGSGEILFDNISVKAIQSLAENGEFSSNRAFSFLGDGNISGGTLNLFNAGGYSYVYQEIPDIEVGKKYLIIADVPANDGNVHFFYTNSSLANVDILSKTSGDTSAFNGVIEFPSLSAAKTFGFRTEPGDTASIDNFEIYDLTESDRSVNDNPLQVVGKLTKVAVATGAEAAAWSGFGANNFLQLPVNDMYSFGTGDLCVMGWAYRGDVVDTLTYLFRQNTVGNNINSYSTGGVHNFRIGSSIIGSVADIKNRWYHWALVRESGVAYLYIDKKLIASKADTQDLSMDDPFLLGKRAEGNGWYGKQAFFRMGATAPTAEQIEHIYNTEKRMFEEDAKCTLSGNSNSIISLSYDEETRKLITLTDVVDHFQDLVNIKQEAISGTGVDITAHGDSLLTATSTQAKYYQPAFNLREELEDKDRVLSLAQAPLIPHVSAGAGQTSIKIPFGYHPEQVFDAGVFKSFTVEYDGFNYYAVITSSTGDVTIMMRLK